MSTLQQSNMVKKRPLDDKETFEVSSKHPRLTEHGNQLFSSLENGFSEDASLVPHISGERGYWTLLLISLKYQLFHLVEFSKLLDK